MHPSCEGVLGPSNIKHPIESRVLDFPINRLLNKAMLLVHETPDQEAADLVWRDRSLLGTRFWRIRCRLADWTQEGYGCLPPSLERIPMYWETPWLSKLRPAVTAYDRACRMLGFPALEGEFKALVKAVAITRTGCWVGDPVPIVLLLDGEDKTAGIYLDGNRRIAAAHYFGRKTVPVVIRPDRCFTLADTYEAHYGTFSRGDCDRWFAHVFDRVTDARR